MKKLKIVVVGVSRCRIGTMNSREDTKDIRTIAIDFEKSNLEEIESMRNK